LKFKTALNNINWNVVRDAEDAQVSYNSFSDIFFNFYELYFPKVTLKVNKKIHKIEPWFSAGLLVSRNTKFLLSSICSKNPSPFNTTKYKTYRNLYNHVLRDAKKKYYDTEFQKNTSNLKRTWELIKSAMNANSSKQTITNLFVDGINHTEPCDIANVLNQFFVSAPAKIVEQIPPAGDPTINFNNEVIFSMQDSPITESEIFDAAKQLLPKNSEDMFGISMKFIKKIMHSIVTPLYYVFSKSFETGIVPSQLKIALTYQPTIDLFLYCLIFQRF